jgi:hypothetical protein
MVTQKFHYHQKQNLTLNKEVPRIKVNSSRIEMKSLILNDTVVADDSSDSDTNTFSKTKLNFGLSSLPSKADLTIKDNLRTYNNYRDYKIEVDRIKRSLKRENH